MVKKITLPLLHEFKPPATEKLGRINKFDITD